MTICDTDGASSFFDKMKRQNHDMFSLLCTIAVFCRDEVYAKQAEDLVKQIRIQDHD